MFRLFTGTQGRGFIGNNCQCFPEQFAAKFNNCFGVASLQVGQIRELGLDAVPDSPSHAQIVGLPHVKEDRDKAERLADLLAQRSSIVWQPSQT